MGLHFNFTDDKMNLALSLLSILLLISCTSFGSAEDGIVCLEPPCNPRHPGLQSRQYLPPPEDTEGQGQKRTEESNREQRKYRPPSDPDWQEHGKR